MELESCLANRVSDVGWSGTERDQQGGKGKVLPIPNIAEGCARVMENQESRISRMMDLASTNLTVALTMISIEAGLLAFVVNLHTKEVLNYGENVTSFPLYQGGPTVGISSSAITILHNTMISLMILSIILSIFALTFCFLHSHDALEMYAIVATRKGQVLPEDTENARKSYRHGLFGLKLGVSLLLGFVLTVLLELVYSLFTSLLLPTILILLYAIMFVYFLILLWLKPVTLRRVKK